MPVSKAVRRKKQARVLFLVLKIQNYTLFWWWSTCLTLCKTVFILQLKMPMSLEVHQTQEVQTAIYLLTTDKSFSFVTLFHQTLNYLRTNLDPPHCLHEGVIHACSPTPLPLMHLSDPYQRIFLCSSQWDSQQDKIWTMTECGIIIPKWNIPSSQDLEIIVVEWAITMRWLTTTRKWRTTKQLYIWPHSSYDSNHKTCASTSLAKSQHG